LPIGPKRKTRKPENGRSVVFDRKNPPSQTEGGAPSSTWSFGVATEVREKKRGLLIAEGVDGVEFGGTRSRIEAGGKTDKDGDGPRAKRMSHQGTAVSSMD